MLQAMQEASNQFYRMAVQTKVHAFVEMTGLMNEFIKVCRHAEEEGIDFTTANTHTGLALPFKMHHAEYLAEKLGCIYGPALLSNDEVRGAFINTLFEGQFFLAEPDMGRPMEPLRAVPKQNEPEDDYGGGNDDD